MKKQLAIFTVGFLAFLLLIYWYASENHLLTADMEQDGAFGMMAMGNGGVYPVPTLDKQLAVLKELGFEFSEKEEKLLSEAGPQSDYADFLFPVGAGDYDYETWEWSPLSKQVYALDTEVFDVGNMYPLFLQGLQAISEEELTFQNIVQDDTKVNWEAGTGTFHVTFTVNEKECAMDLKVNSDWLDCSALNKVNDILKDQGIDKRFYAAWNSYQGMTIFYNTAEWARQFQSKTGSTLFTRV